MRCNRVPSRRHLVRRKLTGCVVALILSIANPGFAQECSAILGFVRDTTTTESQHYAFASFRRWFCDQTFASYQQAREAGLSVGVVLDGLPISIGGNSRVDQWSSYQRVVCETVDSLQWESDAWRVSVSTANRAVVDAWVQCITRPGLHFWGEANIDQPKLITLLAKYVSEGPPYVTQSRRALVEQPTGALECRGDAIRKGTEIDSSPRVLNCVRQNRQAVTVTLSTVNGARVLSVPRIRRVVPSPPKPQAPSLDLMIFSNTGPSGQHPRAEVEVPDGYKIVGGGARVNYQEPGNILTASYPETVRKWVATSKDHGVASPATITVWAVAVYDPSDAWEVQVFTSSSSSAAHPGVTVAVPSDFLMTGGGGRVTYSGYGSLLTASFPVDSRSWQVRAKDHLVSDPAIATAYAIGLRSKNGTALPRSQIVAATGAVNSHPSQQVAVPPGYVMTGGGAIDEFRGLGNMLTAIYPMGETTWVGEGKDHLRGDAAAITVYAIAVEKRP